MELNKRELNLISLALFRLTIEKKALIGCEENHPLTELINELKELSDKIDKERV